MQGHSFLILKETIYSLQHPNLGLRTLWDTKSHQAKGRVKEQEMGLVPNVWPNPPP